MIEALAKLIAAIAILAWPTAAVVFMVLFRSEISSLLKRLKAGKFLGQEISLDQSLRTLNEEAESAVESTPALVDGRQAATGTQLGSLDDPVRRVLDEIPKSPIGALLILGAELERQLRELLWSAGWQHGVRKITITNAIEYLGRTGLVPTRLIGTVRLFLEIRNKILHGYGVTDSDTFRAIDAGISILRAILEIPIEINCVYHPGVEIYADPEGADIRRDVKGLILETKPPGSGATQKRIFPTSQMHYTQGSRVSWEWNPEKTIGASWYRNPDSGNIEPAWSESMEFVGRPLETIGRAELGRDA